MSTDPYPPAGPNPADDQFSGESSAPTDDDLQFDHAEHDGENPDDGGIAACSACQKPLESYYYDVNGGAVCVPCHEQLRQVLTSGSGTLRFFKAVLFGTVGGLIGAGIWWAILALTDYELSIIAIGIAMIVGAGVRMGCDGRGGKLYQFTAVLLTYLAVALGRVPMVVDLIEQDMVEESRAARLTAAADTAENAGTGEATTSDAAAATEPDEAADSAGIESLPAAERILIYIGAFILSLALPILSLLSMEIMGPIILGIGLYVAWGTNKKRVIQITGPFQLNAPAQPETLPAEPA